MKKFLSLIEARNKEFYRDRSALIWTLLFPFIVLLGFTYGYSGHQDPILRITSISSSRPMPAVILDFQKTPGLEFLTTNDESAALKKLERYECDLVISGSTDGKHFTYSLNR